MQVIDLNPAKQCVLLARQGIRRLETYLNILVQCHISVTPENVRKPMVF